ncbi:MAG: 2OG-Fe(II) oxygenase [Bdellovibrionales bacterium]|nr:2OG-Fe(II) oxygenase [Bdellovibrionales bacterium]
MSLTLVKDYSVSQPWLVYSLDQAYVSSFYKQVANQQTLFGTGDVYCGRSSQVNRSHRCCVDLKDVTLARKLGRKIQSLVDLQLNEMVQKLGVTDFKFDKVDFLCSSYRDGYFFKVHKDLVLLDPNPRVISWVFYFHREPRTFSGGDLVFYDQGKELGRMASESGLLVVFRSDLSHEVTPVSCPSRDFRDSRFALSGFIRTKPTFKSTVLSRARYVVRDPRLQGIRQMKASAFSLLRRSML